MSYTTVVPGTAITASWANANVRDQVITPFATATARDSAVTAPIEGMVCYLSDTDELWEYMGTAWRPVNTYKVVGAKYATGGTLATSSSTEVAMTAWTGGDATINFVNNYLYRVELSIGAADSGATGGVGGTAAVRVRRTVNSTSAAVCGLWQLATAGGGAVKSATAVSYVKNVSGADIAASLGLTVTKSVGGDALIYGDAAGLPGILTVARLGPVAEYASLTAAAIAWAIT